VAIRGGKFSQLVLLAVSICAVWTFLRLFFVSQQRAVSVASNRVDDIDELTIETIVSMVVWALLTPPLGMAERLPMEGR
jgi:hypothetical protein